MVRNPSFPQPDLLSADELFSDGVLLPLRLLSLQNKPDPPDQTPQLEPESPNSESNIVELDPETDLSSAITETATLAQKNSEATKALAVQSDVLEKEFGEIQKVLLAMQEQQQKQLDLIFAIGKTGKLWEDRQEMIGKENLELELVMRDFGVDLAPTALRRYRRRLFLHLIHVGTLEDFFYPVMMPMTTLCLGLTGRFLSRVSAVYG